MKKILIALILFGCSSTSQDPEPKTGCHSGVSKSTGQWVFLECVTHDEYMKGEIRFPSWDNYSQHKWELCPDCK